jgi:hypothetical protein
MSVTRTHNLQQTASVAVLFWGACLVLVAIEATVGANMVSSALFFLSIPAMVTDTALATLAVSVFVYASVILLFGLLAASSLKTLLVDA